jgi:metal-responsive CopG/Arc/MetJ family transcriptional regulator
MNEAPDDRIVVRLPGDLLRALDRFIEEREGREDRPQAVASALREWAHARGYLDEPGDEGIRPEDLSAANDG